MKDGGLVLEVSIKKPDEVGNYEITIKCIRIPSELINVLNSLQVEKHLIGYVESNMYRINPQDIFYVESVDKRIFLYSEHNVFSSKQRLYELEEILKFHDFIRISKTTIVNLNKIKTVTPAPSGKLEATLMNNEKIIISRQYTSVLKTHLGL